MEWNFHHNPVIPSCAETELFNFLVPREITKKTLISFAKTACLVVLTVTSAPELQIRGGKGYFSIDVLEFSIQNLIEGWKYPL